MLTANIRLQTQQIQLLIYEKIKRNLRFQNSKQTKHCVWDSHIKQIVHDICIKMKKTVYIRKIYPFKLFFFFNFIMLNLLIEGNVLNILSILKHDILVGLFKHNEKRTIKKLIQRSTKISVLLEFYWSKYLSSIFY